MKPANPAKTFWKYFIVLFIIYLTAFQSIYFILDADNLVNALENHLALFICKMIAIGMVAAYISAIWVKKQLE